MSKPPTANPDDQFASTRKQWQDYVGQLARLEARRNGHEYQPVPDTTHGDHGLEGYTTGGIGYQAYYPDTGVAPKVLKKKILKKVEDDLQKLDDYREFWADALKGNPLSKWVLVTPSIPDKKLLKEANGLAQDLLGKQLPFISPTLKVLLHTAKDYEEAAAQLGAACPSELPMPPVTLVPADMTRFRVERQKIIDDIEAKLRKITQLSGTGRANVMRSLIESLLQYEGHIESLRQLAPPVAEKLLTYRSSKADTLRIESELATGDQRQRLAALMKEVEDDIATNCPKVPASKRGEIARGLVANWTSECPLDFPSEQL